MSALCETCAADDGSVPAVCVLELKVAPGVYEASCGAHHRHWRHTDCEPVDPAAFYYGVIYGPTA